MNNVPAVAPEGLPLPSDLRKKKRKSWELTSLLNQIEEAREKHTDRDIWGTFKTKDIYNSYSDGVKRGLTNVQILTNLNRHLQDIGAKPLNPILYKEEVIKKPFWSTLKKAIVSPFISPPIKKEELPTPKPPFAVPAATAVPSALIPPKITVPPARIPPTIVETIKKERREPFGLSKAAKYIRKNWTEYIVPFSPGSALKAGEVVLAATRAEKNKYPAGQEYQRTADQYLIKNYLEEIAEMNEATWGAKTLLGIAHLIPWGLEFAMTGGLYTGVKIGVTKSATRLLGKIATRKAGQIALKTTGWVAGSSARTFALPHRIGENILRRRIPEQMSFGERGEFKIDVPPEKWATALAKGYGATLVEVASEVTGGAITKGLSTVGRKLPLGRLFIPMLEKAWLKLHPNKSALDFTKKMLTRVGYNGLIGEIGEERVVTILHTIANTNDFGAGKDANMFERLMAGFTQDVKNFPVELAVLSVPMAGGVVLSKVIAKTMPTVKEIPPTEPKIAVEVTAKPVPKIPIMPEVAKPVVPPIEPKPAVLPEVRPELKEVLLSELKGEPMVSEVIFPHKAIDYVVGNLTEEEGKQLSVMIGRESYPDFPVFLALKAIGELKGWGVTQDNIDYATSHIEAAKNFNIEKYGKGFTNFVSQAEKTVNNLIKEAKIIKPEVAPEAIPPKPVPEIPIKPEVPSEVKEVPAEVKLPTEPPKTSLIPVFAEKKRVLAELQSAYEKAKPMPEDVKEEWETLKEAPSIITIEGRKVANPIYKDFLARQPKITLKTDGEAQIVNYKETIAETIKRYKQVPAKMEAVKVEKYKAPAIHRIGYPSSALSKGRPFWDIGEGLITEGSLAIKAPLSKVTYHTTVKPETAKDHLIAIKELLASPSAPANIDYYTYVGEEGEFVYLEPLKNIKGRAFVRNTVTNKYSPFDQQYVEKILELYPDAEFELVTTEGEQEEMLKTLDKGKPVGILMPIKDITNTGLEMYQAMQKEEKIKDPYPKEETDMMLDNLPEHTVKGEETPEKDLQEYINSSISQEKALNILANISKTLGVNIRVMPRMAEEGKFSRTLKGEIVGIRIQALSKIKTLSHELGHLLDFVMGDYKYPKTLAEKINIDPAIEPVLREELKAVSDFVRPFNRATATRGILAYRNNHKELFADYISLVAYLPLKARKLAPNFTNAFVKRIQEEPKFSAFMSQLTNTDKPLIPATPNKTLMGKLAEELCDFFDKRVPEKGVTVEQKKSDLVKWGRDKWWALDIPHTIGLGNKAFYPVFNALQDGLYEAYRQEKKLSDIVAFEAQLQLPQESKEKIAESIWRGTELGKEFTQEELRTAWKLSPLEITHRNKIMTAIKEAVRLYIEAKKLQYKYDELSDEEQQALESYLTEEILRLEGYFPISRHGEWSVYGEQGKGRWMSRMDSKKNAIKLANLLSKMGYAGLKVYPTKNIPAYIMQQYKSFNIYDLENILEAVGEDIPKGQEAYFKEARQYIDGLVKRLKAKRGFERHLLKRTYVPGYERDFDNILETTAHFTEEAARKLGMTRARRVANEAIKNIEDPELKAMVQEWVNTVVTAPPIGLQVVRRGIYYYFLTIKTTLIVQDFTTPFLTTYVELSKYVKMGLGEKIFAKGMRDMSASAMRRLTNEELKADIKRAGEEKVTGFPFMEELVGRRKVRLKTPKTPLERAKQWTLRTGDIVSVVAESFGRVGEIARRKHAFITGWHIADYLNQHPELREKIAKRYTKTPGFEILQSPVIDKYEFAKRFTEKTQGIYGTHNLPRIITGGGTLKAPLRLIYIFMHYLHQFMRKWVVWVGGREQPLAGRIKAVATLVGATGIMGLPFMNLLFYFLAKVFHQDPERWIRKRLPRRLADTVMRGLPTLSGVDVSRVLGLGDILTPKRSPEEFLGAGGGIMKNVKTAIELYKGGKQAQAIEMIAPPFIKAPMMAERWKKEGVQTARGLIYKPTPKELWLKRFQIQPAEVTTAYAQQRSLEITEAARTRAMKLFRQRLVNATFQAYLAPSAKKQAEWREEKLAIRKRIREWNASRPANVPRIEIPEVEIKKAVIQKLQEKRARGQWRWQERKIKKTYE